MNEAYISKTNEFNALSGLTQAMQLRLTVLALSGNSPVSTFADLAEREGLSPEARERREQEEQRQFQEHLQAIHEQSERFQEQLSRLEQASAEALLENERQLRLAQEELERIRERAYEITMPDGTIEKVYRDGDKVRAETGEEIGSEIVKPDDIGAAHSTWSEFQKASRHVSDLEDEHTRIVEFNTRLQGARGRFSADDLSLDELDALQAQVNQNMPQSVRERFEASSSAAIPETLQPQETRDAAATDSLAIPFTKAAAMSNALEDDSPESDPEIKPRRPAVSAPAPM